MVYIKPPFASPQSVVKYLGQYTHRIAISNHRIISFENGMVTFSWKDYADNYRRKTMTLGFVEFIRRFLMHVVPKGFMRIRHYGFLANRNRKMKLARCRSFFRKTPPTQRARKTNLVDRGIQETARVRSTAVQAMSGGYHGDRCRYTSSEGCYDYLKVKVLLRPG